MLSSVSTGQLTIWGGESKSPSQYVQGLTGFCFYSSHQDTTASTSHDVIVILHLLLGTVPLMTYVTLAWISFWLLIFFYLQSQFVIICLFQYYVHYMWLLLCNPAYGEPGLGPAKLEVLWQRRWKCFGVCGWASVTLVLLQTSHSVRRDQWLIQPPLQIQN